MKSVIIISALAKIMFLLMHEFDACYHKEWKMMPFLKTLSSKAQYLFFLYFHIPLTLFLFYYAWSVVELNNKALWVIMNIVSVVHLIMHSTALKWDANVFKNIHSFVFITGAGIAGVIGLVLTSYY